MDLSGFNIQLSSDQYTWIALVMACVQVFKGLPKVCVVKPYLPVIVPAVFVALAVAYGWPNAVPTGLTMGLIAIGAYRASNAVEKARQIPQVAP